MKDAQQRQKRCQENRCAFNERRDAAELLAAREQYEEGDLAEARQRVERLLVRTPKHREAQALLAEVDGAEKVERGKGAEKSGSEEQPVVRTSWVPDPALPGESAHRELPSPPAPLPPTAARCPGRGEKHEKELRAAKADDDENAGSTAADRVAALLSSAEAALREGAEGSTLSALARIQEAQAINPQDPQIPISAAGILLRYNRPEAASRLLSEASGRFPNSAAIHRMLGTAAYRLGDYKNSQVAFQQALSLDKSSALAYFLMGSTLAKLGQADAAAAHFRQAAVLDPRFAVER